MALANFFDRALQSAAQALRGFEAAAFEAKLDEAPIGIAFDAEASRSPEGRATLDMAVRLLSRLYPKIAIVPLGAAQGLAQDLADLARSINPAIEVRGALDGVDVALALGRTAIDCPQPVYVGSDGWVARVSTLRPVGSGSGGANPFGAGAAACLGAANVFRALFAAGLPPGGLDRDAAVSLLDYSTGAAPANPPWRDLDIGLVRLVGLGAIGNGAIWALGRAGGLGGMLDLIDHERVELTNLQRYVLATQRDVDLPKVDVAAAHLAGSGLASRHFQKTWRGYVEELGDWRIERVAVALDTVADRLEVQGSLPGWIANAWTQAGDLGISRHRFLGDQACMACLYLPSAQAPSEDELIAREIGLTAPGSVPRIREMLYRGDAVGEAFVREVAGIMGLSPEILMPFTSLPLRSFRTRAVCGASVLRVKGADTPAAEVPLAFQSAMAGIMLAAEVVAECGGQRGHAWPTKTVVDLTRPLPTRWSVPVLKRPAASGPQCICQDADYVRAYRRKYDEAHA